MNIEYEATFKIKSKDDFRLKLKEVGVKLIKKEFLQKRYTFNLPESEQNKKSWARVRDEGDKITMSVKTIEPGRIEGQKETELIINSLENGISFLENTGFKQKSYQETLRELWVIDDVEITIDTWPYLEPIVEIEGKSEKEVRMVSEKVGFKYTQAIFEGIDYFYNLKYGVDKYIINNEIPLITFEGTNPFINK